MNYDNNAVLPDLEMRDKVKNALSITSSQVATHQYQAPNNNQKQQNQQNQFIADQRNNQSNLDAQTISPQSQLQNEIQNNLEALLQYKNKL